MIEIPNEITLEYVNELRSRALDLSFESSEIITKILDIELDDKDIDIELNEKDLFHLGEEKLKIRRGIISLVLKAIDLVIAPRIGYKRRLGTNINDEDIVYLELNGKIYVTSGGYNAGYYNKTSPAYTYIKALNVSGILDKCLE